MINNLYNNNYNRTNDRMKLIKPNRPYISTTIRLNAYFRFNNKVNSKYLITIMNNVNVKVNNAIRLNYEYR